MVTYRYKVRHTGFDGQQHTIVVCIPENELKQEHTFNDVVAWCEKKGISAARVYRVADGYTKGDLIAVRHGGKIKTL